MFKLGHIIIEIQLKDLNWIASGTADITGISQPSVGTESVTYL
jgi:hypothetical protein